MLRPVDQGLPDGPDEGVQLLDRRLAELGGGLRDEVGPELAGILICIHGRREVDEVLLEPERLEAVPPRGFGREDDSVTSLLEDLADPDAVVRRPVGALGHEDDGERVGHVAPVVVGSGARSWLDTAAYPYHPARSATEAPAS